jgi:glucose-1-phosphate adenylyltransferase
VRTGDELAQDTVAVVLAGGRGVRLGPLTRHVCRPAVPFGAIYRSIDFSLANSVNSGILRIGVATQHKPEVLHRHLDTAWRRPGSGGFIASWQAEACAPNRGYQGTADAVFRNWDAVERLGSRYVLVLAGDHVYKMDYRPMLDSHRRHGAGVTVGMVQVRVEDAHEFGVLSVGSSGCINRFVEKPKTRHELPAGSAGVPVSMGIYVFDIGFLGDVLARDAVSRGSRHDFGHDILPEAVRAAAAYAYPFRPEANEAFGYWRDIGTPTAYWRAHMDLIGPSPRFTVDDPGWPLQPARISPRVALHTATDHAGLLADSLMSPDVDVLGKVRRSVLFSGVSIAAGAEVADSVILPGATVGRGCRVRGAIIASGCRVPDYAVLEGRWTGSTPDIDRCEPVIADPAEPSRCAPSIHEWSALHLAAPARLSGDARGVTYEHRT